jgi:hypothetical protein
MAAQSVPRAELPYFCDNFASLFPFYAFTGHGSSTSSLLCHLLLHPPTGHAVLCQPSSHGANGRLFTV